MGSLEDMCVLLIQLFQYTVQWRSFVNRVINISIKYGRFWLTKKLTGNLLVVEVVCDLIDYLDKYVAYAIGQ
jgi:hypothetical protein